ncbi:MAG TPA: hypothetical protein VNJ03_04235 [Vicinamibacterales bacterium]|nr:hypothetical protein [Vicinamibacterales bacterium]
MRFEGMDRNRDGVITRQEWQGSAESFRVHDWNGDGRLSGDEVRPGGRRQQRNRDEDDYEAARGREFDDWTQEGFTALDHNRDGRLTRDEWHYDNEGWVRADRNRDNVLSRAEFMGGEGDDADDDDDTDREDRFDYLDANNNGRIERREWHGDRDTFDWLDQNDDGALSKTEMRGEETPDTRESDLFASLDYNRDNRLSQDEWHWSRRSFLQQDVNRDGTVSRQEFSEPSGSGSAPVPGVTPPSNPTQPMEVIVSARAGWVDTGIDVRAGDVLVIRADGTVRLSGNSNDSAGPGGGNRRADNASMPNHPSGALIARVANGAAIFVGDGRAMNRLATGGRLYLAVNDDYSADNSGQFRATVTVRRDR